jgi:hypothetical protein
MQADNRFCRNCPHHRDGHITAYNLDKMEHPLAFRVCYGSNDSYYDIPCNCKEYIPKDNLEYLEWCVENKRSQYETAKR